MNLIIDVGNTQFKLCVFNQGKIVHSFFCDDFTPEVYQREIKKYPIQQCLYSSTRVIVKSKFEQILPSHIKVLALNEKTPLPINIAYHTPETLGKDRIAAAVGAQQIFNNTAILIIDIGTAMTIDFIDKESVYHGGIISPGPETRYRSLSEFTGKLPLLQGQEMELQLHGQSTNDAIHYGVQNGMLFEINEYILRYTRQNSELKIVLTGGYSYLFDKKINYPIFAELFLVPIGLNRILEYNDN